jgi:hypothetical protein
MANITVVTEGGIVQEVFIDGKYANEYEVLDFDTLESSDVNEIRNFRDDVRYAIQRGDTQLAEVLSERVRDIVRAIDYLLK